MVDFTRPMINVYIASILKYAKMFCDLRDEWKDKNIHLYARWHDMAQLELDKSSELSPADFHIFWSVDEEDVRHSDALIVYGELNDNLRGALVEVGMAIALGKLVIVVGECKDFGTWQYHPSVVCANDFYHAKTMILRRFHSSIEYWK